MATESEKYISNAIAINGGSALSQSSYSPNEFADRQKQYMSSRTKLFNNKRAYLSTDYCEARVQGTTSNFYEYVNTHLRLSEVSTNNRTAFDAKRSDDWKEILLPDLNIGYLPIGAKIETMGSTWIVLNPYNLSSPMTTAVICRCNASYNFYDDYGNVITEPIIVEKASMLMNANELNENVVNKDGYFNITCQLNDNTKKLALNKRIVLGTQPYTITGYTDFIQEFTGDRNSAHLLSFAARIDEPNELDDVSENFIASGNGQEYSAKINGVDSLMIGITYTYTAQLLLNGNPINLPTTWIWKSSNETLLTISNTGEATTSSEHTGDVTITAILAQNPNITATFNVYVGGSSSGAIIECAKSVTQYQSVTVTAKFYGNYGVEITTPATWSFENVPQEYYTVQISNDTRSAVITALSASNTPLKINVSVSDGYHTVSGTKYLTLEGY